VTTAVDATLTTPVVAAAAVGALVLLVAVWPAVGAFLTVAHEAGHVAAAVLTGRQVLFFEVINENAGRTRSEDKGWGPARIFISFVGYVTPPLLGLGGAALFDAGRILPLLWTAVVLLVLTLFKAEREWTTFVVLLLAAATGYVALYGDPVLQAGFAAGLVWLLLFGGAYDAAGSSKTKGTDADQLFRDTLIPRTLWKLGFIVVAIVCLWKGAQLMVP
jgi:hypothetical protein